MTDRPAMAVFVGRASFRVARMTQHPDDYRATHGEFESASLPDQPTPPLEDLVVLSARIAGGERDQDHAEGAKIDRAPVSETRQLADAALAIQAPAAAADPPNSSRPRGRPIVRIMGALCAGGIVALTLQTLWQRPPGPSAMNESARALPPRAAVVATATQKATSEATHEAFHEAIHEATQGAATSSARVPPTVIAPTIAFIAAPRPTPPSVSKPSKRGHGAHPSGAKHALAHPASARTARRTGVKWLDPVAQPSGRAAARADARTASRTSGKWVDPFVD